MTTHQYLLEVGLEEVPAKYVRQTSEQFAERVADFLKDQRLTYEDIKAFATPRRFGVLVSGLNDKQADLTEIAKGPAKRIAQDEEGNWTKAAQGFARGKGVSTDDIYFEKVKGEEYVHIEINIAGKTAGEILPAIKKEVTDMTFPVSMHWGDHDFKYIRPIHWIVSLLDEAVVPFSVLDVTADRHSRGHRFLGAQDVIINRAADFEAALSAEFVIVDQEKRKDLIVNQIKAIETENNYFIERDEDLLEEVTQIVEYPTAFLGDFDEKYLQLPDIVLITSMREHQRYFSVQNQDSQLEPHFVAVRNGNGKNLDNVRLGNEKVLVARLEDALFFIEEDKQMSIDDYVKKLKKVTFHAEIGTIAEKMQRVGKIVHYLCDKWSMRHVKATQIDRTAAIYKFDLVTGMVDEFSELQGIIGELYAKEAGEDEAIAKAISEHYMPTGSDAQLPDSNLGILFAIAEKIDTIISFFQINRIPSGSNDPFALRRQMIGIVSILEANQLSFNWQTDIQTLLTDVYGVTDEAEVTDLIVKLRRFVSDRLKQNLQQKGIRYDISEAVRASSAADVNIKITAANVIQAAKEDANFKATIEAWSRILNLRGKALELKVDTKIINTALFETASEKALYNDISDLQLTDSVADNFQSLAQLTPVITDFFDNNMIFTDDEAVRHNRLALLAQIAKNVRQIADVTLLQTK